MTINGINGTNAQMGQMGMNQARDSYSRNIQNKIANAERELQELSSNEDMTLEEKMKKRQEIQRQISDLKMQLRQHQMEQRRAMRDAERQQAKESFAGTMPDDARNAGNAKAGGKGAGLSQAGMTAIISAEGSIKQAKVQGSVAAKMEGRSGVLQSEIKLDQARGNDTRKKEEELAEVEQKAQAATASQLSTLADANKAMEEAAQTDSREEKADHEAGKTGSDEKDAEENMSDGNARSEVFDSGRAEAAETNPRQPVHYVPVDIRL